MATSPFTAPIWFHAQKSHPGEPLPFFVQDLERLLQSALLGLDENACEKTLIL